MESISVQERGTKIIDRPETEGNLPPAVLKASAVVRHRLPQLNQTVWVAWEQPPEPRITGPKDSAEQHISAPTLVQDLVSQYVDRRDVKLLELIDSHLSKGQEVIYYTDEQGRPARALFQPVLDSEQQVAGLGVWVETEDKLALSVLAAEDAGGKWVRADAMPTAAPTVKLSHHRFVNIAPKAKAYRSQLKRESFGTPSDKPFVPVRSRAEYQEWHAGLSEIGSTHLPGLRIPSIPQQFEETATH